LSELRFSPPAPTEGNDSKSEPPKKKVPSIDYKNVIGGRLKLKKTSSLHPPRDKDSNPREIKRQITQTQAKAREARKEIKQEEIKSDQIILRDGSHLTKAEQEFEEAQKRRAADLITKRIAKTHRQTIEEFNKKMANLSEHYDMPRVGPG